MWSIGGKLLYHLQNSWTVETVPSNLTAAAYSSELLPGPIYLSYHQHQLFSRGIGFVVSWSYRRSSVSESPISVVEENIVSQAGEGSVAGGIGATWITRQRPERAGHDAHSRKLGDSMKKKSPNYKMKSRKDSRTKEFLGFCRQEGKNIE